MKGKLKGKMDVEKLGYESRIKILFRSPTLSTVQMVEETIEKNSGEFNRTQIWKKLPRKVMWQTYLVILEYLQSINKIGISKKGILVHIWCPEVAKKFSKRKEIKL